METRTIKTLHRIHEVTVVDKIQIPVRADRLPRNHDLHSFLLVHQCDFAVHSVRFVGASRLPHVLCQGVHERQLFRRAREY